MNEFLGKNIVITGGASGIGKGLVSAFAAEGGSVAFSDVNSQAGQLTCQQVIESSGNDRVYFYPADMFKEDEIAQFARKVLSQLGDVDVLVNNVGENFAEGTLLQHSLLVFDKTYALNIRCAVQCTQQFLPGMQKKKGGAIIFISSTMSLGARGFSAYSMSKGALNSLTSTLALDHAGENIRVNAVAPGLIATTRTQAWIDSQNDAAVAKGIPMGVVGVPEDVSQAVLFLASQRARYITGQILVVDGGLSIGE